MFELGQQCVELAAATPNVDDLGVQQLRHVPAGHFTVIAEINDAADLNLTLDLATRIKVYGRRMDITLLYFDGCPHWKVADDRLTVIAAERSDISVTHRLVASVDGAEWWGFHGSPSILVDGVDLFADSDAGVGLSCRVYQTPGGPSGATTLDQLRAAITHA